MSQTTPGANEPKPAGSRRRRLTPLPLDKQSRRFMWLQIATPFLAILFASLIGSLIMLAIGKDPLNVYARMFSFSFGRADSIATILFRATPLIFAGLASAIAFKINVFNIGVEGQYLMGAMMASIVGFTVKGLPAYIHLPLVIVAAMLGGALWALLPAYLKVKRGVHEVISTIMLNYVAASLLHFFIANVFMDKSQVVGQGGMGSPRMRMPLIEASARMPTLHSFFAHLGVNFPPHVYVNWFLFIGIALAAVLFYVIWRTPFGYEIRAVAQNPTAAEAAGINSKRQIFRTFLISGAIAGLVGLSDLLGFFGYMDIDFPRGRGFDGIAVALLGKNDPFGVILGALLFGFLSRGSEGVLVFSGVPAEVITIIQGVMILSIVVAYEIVTRYIRVQKKKEAIGA
ncbi:MAG TPA: ABC transporter permease [Bacillota bacterium]